jgi:transposase-like protein
MGRRGYPPELRRKVLDLVEAGRSVADVARDLEISDQSIYTWRRRDRIDRGLVPGLSSGERAELARAKLRIAEQDHGGAEGASAKMLVLETELRAMRQGPGPRLVRIGTEWFLAVSSGASLVQVARWDPAATRPGAEPPDKEEVPG